MIERIGLSCDVHDALKFVCKFILCTRQDVYDHVTRASISHVAFLGAWRCYIDVYGHRSEIWSIKHVCSRHAALYKEFEYLALMLASAAMQMQSPALHVCDCPAACKRVLPYEMRRKQLAYHQTRSHLCIEDRVIEIYRKITRTCVRHLASV